MIPGFEDSIIGKEPSEFSIKSTFPDDYFKKDLAGIEAEFKINLKTIQELSAAKVDEELFKKLEMDVKDEAAFK